MRRMLRYLFDEKDGRTTIFHNNSSAIALSNNSVFHKRTKHIDAKYNFIRELVNNDEIVLQHCRLEEQFADISTKPLESENFVYLRDCLGMVNHDSCD